MASLIVRVAATLLLAVIATRGRAEFRSFDGTGNNLTNPDWGSVGTNFARFAPADYVDGVQAPHVNDRPNPRSVGVELMRKTEVVPSARRLSGYVYAFGNLISHDTQRTIAGGAELIPFRIPFNDDQFLPNQTFPLTRSVFDPTTGTGPDNPREQVNFASSFLDASTIYGSDDENASILRGGPANPGAKLKTSNDINGDLENLLPRDAFGPNPNAPFVAGDSRVADNPPLTALHTVFMREHNRLVDEFAAAHPEWDSEELYQRARKRVGAQIQAITYNEFLPSLLGAEAPTPSSGYDADLEPAVFNAFPAVFLRIGHSMLPDEFLLVEDNGAPAPEGNVRLDMAFDNPAVITTSRDLDLFIKGLSVEVQEETDLTLADGMRLGLLDAIDIQRARDHGIADYNSLREALGLSRIATFAEITSDPETQAKLQSLYGDIDNVDAFVGVLAEELLPGASVGPSVAAAFRLQFERLRDGDRFFYEWDPDFTPDEVAALRATRLSDVIARNTGVTTLQENVFSAAPIPEPASAALLLLAAMLGRRRR